MWPDLTKASFHTKQQGWLFTAIQYLHQWTNNPCAYHCQWFSGLLFLGLVSWAYLTCSSVQVVFKWQWFDLASTHLAGNHHTTGQKTCPSNWFLFVIFRIQMGLRWDHLTVSTSTHGKTSHFVAPHHLRPPPLHIWSFVIVVQELFELAGNSASCLLNSWSTERHCITMD